MKSPTKLEIRDQAVFKLDVPDPGFSPEKNKAVVENSIRKYDAMRRKKAREFDDAYAERSDALITYLKALERGRVNPDLAKFFDPKYLAFLRGDDIRREIMARVTILDNNGNVIRKGSN